VRRSISASDAMDETGIQVERHISEFATRNKDDTDVSCACSGVF
jgi:hypothetical protein